MELILDLDSKNKIKSHIYIIKNKINDKVYIGQANTHRLNRKKYRFFGYTGRFNDHISEAMVNTKKKQCWYLNNSIRKNGAENFYVELIETCDLEKADEMEKYYIKHFNSLYPNGYNLTKGGKDFTDLKIDKDLELNPVREKRGRDFGYIHKATTKEKMKLYQQNAKQNIEYVEAKRKNLSVKLSETHKHKRINVLSKLNLQKPLDQYIFPVHHKDTDKIKNYAIRIKTNEKNLEYMLHNNDTIDKKYIRLLEILNLAYDKK
jgi:hypothetical protein